MFMFIDTHAHLTDSKFDADRRETIARARAAGIGHIIEIGCECDEWEAALRLAAENPDVSCALGIHPQAAASADAAALARLETLAQNSRVVGIGETGLDYHYEKAPREVQKEVFKLQIGIARRRGKPLVIHCREAYADFMPIVDEFFPAPSERPGVIHCFSGTPAEALKLADLGFCIGIDGPVTYPSSRALRETVVLLPARSLLLETDCPYLAPQARRGTRNEPAYVPMIAEEVARARQIPLEELARITGENARALFQLGR